MRGIFLTQAFQHIVWSQNFATEPEATPNEGRTLRVMDRSRRSVHMRNEGHLFSLARLGIVHHVAHPLRGAFDAIAGSEIIRGFELVCRPG